MRYYMASATGTYALTGLEPSADRILEAINAVFPPSSATWVGPLPRITRTGTDTGLLLNPIAAADTMPTVHVAWAFYLPDETVNPDAVAQTVVTPLASTLNGISAISGHWTASVAPYDTALNGDISFWQSGQAANTVSRDETPTAGGPNVANENPVGPVGSPSLFQSLNPFAPPSPGGTSAVDALKNLLIVVGVVGGGGLLVYELWPWLSGARRMQSRRSRARANPTRRRRRSRMRRRAA